MSINPEYYSKHSVRIGDEVFQPFLVFNDMKFGLGNIAKYLLRFQDKGGVEDLNKALTYIELYLDNYRRFHGFSSSIYKNVLRKQLIEDQPLLSYLLKENLSIKDIMDLREEVFKLKKEYEGEPSDLTPNRVLTIFSNLNTKLWEINPNITLYSLNPQDFDKLVLKFTKLNFSTNRGNEEWKRVRITLIKRMFLIYSYLVSNILELDKSTETEAYKSLCDCIFEISNKFHTQKQLEEIETNLLKIYNKSLLPNNADEIEFFNKKPITQFIKVTQL